MEAGVRDRGNLHRAAVRTGGPLARRYPSRRARASAYRRSPRTAPSPSTGRPGARRSRRRRGRRRRALRHPDGEAARRRAGHRHRELGPRRQAMPRGRRRRGHRLQDRVCARQGPGDHERPAASTAWSRSTSPAMPPCSPDRGPRRPLRRLRVERPGGDVRVRPDDHERCGGAFLHRLRTVAAGPRARRVGSDALARGRSASAAIAARLPLERTAEAHELVEQGRVIGNVIVEP